MRGRRRFADRVEAGRLLGERLKAYAGRPDVVVLGLPRGGVPVAAEVATALGVPLDVCVVRKVGLPYQPELAMGAIASGGVRVFNDEVIRLARVSPEMIDAAVSLQQGELERRERLYRAGRPPIPLGGKVVILVDDGLATGATMRAAVAAVRHLRPARIIVAAPVGAPDTCRRLEATADEVICVEEPFDLTAVGVWYDDFTATTDDDVRALLGATPCLP